MRFPGFKGEWEVKKLGEVCEIKTGNKDTQNKVEEGKYPFFVRSNTVERIDSYSYDGEAILTSGDGVGVGKNFHYINGKFDFHQRVYALRDFREGYSGKYIYHLFSEKFHDRVRKLSAKNSVDSVRMDMISEMKVYFPLLLEQQKISSFLSHIDERIRTQNKIIEELKLLKNTISKKIFLCQLRFKNHKGIYFQNWETKKLKDVCEIIGGGTPETNKPEYWNGNIQWFTPTEIKSNFVSKSERTISHLGLKNSSAKLLPKGTILLTTRATIGEVSIALEECTTNQGFQSLIVKENYNNIFLFNWLKINKYELEKRANGSTFAEISKSEIEKIQINIPDIEEQAKISDSLSSIDIKIDIEVKFLQKLKEQKKYVIANLFI